MGSYEWERKLDTALPLLVLRCATTADADDAALLLVAESSGRRVDGSA